MMFISVIRADRNTNYPNPRGNIIFRLCFGALVGSLAAAGKDTTGIFICSRFFTRRRFIDGCITATVTGRPLKPGGGRPIFRARQSKYMGARGGQMTSSTFKDIFSGPFGWEIQI